MSLDSLPVEIVALIGGKLAHSDRMNLMQTSKKYEKIGRAYRMDKMHLYFLRICNVSTDSGEGIIVDLTFRGYSEKRRTIWTKHSIEDILKTVAYVLFFILNKMLITSDIAKQIKESASKKVMLNLIGCELDLSLVELKSTVKEFEGTSLNEIKWANERQKQMMYDETFIDLLENVIEFTMHEHPWTQIEECRNITDRVLQKLPEIMRRDFQITSYCTGFTLDGITNTIKAAYNSRVGGHNWQLGWVHVENKSEAAREIFNLSRQLPIIKIRISPERFDRYGRIVNALYVVIDWKIENCRCLIAGVSAIRFRISEDV